MAKRYIKISPFYNRPSTAGPLSAERLNAINDGLEAVDTYKIDVDAIVNNGVTTVEGTVLDGRMGKTLQDQVNTINNNLAIQDTININGCTTLGELFTILRSTPHRVGKGNVGNLDTSNLKSLLGNPPGFGNYTGVYVRCHSYNVLTVVAVAEAGTTEKIAESYIWYNNNVYFKSAWNVIV